MSILPPHLNANERRLIDENERLQNRIDGFHKRMVEAVAQARQDTWKRSIEIVNEKLIGNRGMFTVASDVVDAFEAAAKSDSGEQ